MWLIGNGLAFLALAQPPQELPKTPPLSTLEAEVANGLEPRVLTLDECLAMSMEHQPRIQAAMASLRAARAAHSGIHSLRGLAKLSPDLGIRKSQSDHGLAVANAVLRQETEDTRYAVRRAYFTVIYAEAQAERLRRLAEILEKGNKKTSPNVWLDDTFGISSRLRMTLTKTRSNLAIAEVGRLKARYLLLEEMGGKRAIGFLPEPAEKTLPKPIINITLDELESLMGEHRGERILAREGVAIANLEAEAQRRSLPFKFISNSFASFSSNNATPVPTPERGGEYRPGAINLEMPPNFGGPKRYRVERAEALADRAELTNETTTNLTNLEARVAFLTLREIERRILADKASIAEVRMIFLRASQSSLSTQDGMVLGQAVEILVDYEELHLKHVLIASELMRETCGALEIPFEPRQPDPSIPAR